MLPKRHFPLLLSLLFAVLLLPGCAPKMKLFSDSTDPLLEYTLEGEGDAKIAVIAVRGMISDSPRTGLLRTKPSVVQDVVARLRLAREDEDVRAVIVQVDSPGGTITASDILYNEIKRFKAETKKPVLAVFMDLSASGGYYLSLPCDEIWAHPTTVTGSVGAVFMRPNVTGLMDMAGVSVAVSKSGRNKDMGSPFRTETDEERELMDRMMDEFGGRFLGLVQEHRKLTPEAAELVATARIFAAPEAERLGLVDAIGYMDEVIDRAEKLAGVEQARVVAYRRSAYPDDTVYNTEASAEAQLQLIKTGLESALPPKAGFYYAWPGAFEQ